MVETFVNANIMALRAVLAKVFLKGFRGDRQTGCLPSFPAAGEGARFGPSGFLQLSRRTGAGGFIRSSAEGKEPRLPRHIQFLKPLDGTIRRNSQRSQSAQFGAREAMFRAHVENEVRLSRLLDGAHFRDGDGHLPCRRI